MYVSVILECDLNVCLLSFLNTARFPCLLAGDKNLSQLTQLSLLTTKNSAGDVDFRFFTVFKFSSVSNEGINLCGKNQKYLDDFFPNIARFNN